MKQACLYEAPFGNITLIFDGGELVELNLHGDLAHAPYPLPDEWQQRLDDYFSGRLKNFAWPISKSGTPYQQKVWQAIAEIPAGEVMSYQDIARKIGSAPRAVGGACGKKTGRTACAARPEIRKAGCVRRYAGSARHRVRLCGAA